MKSILRSVGTWRTAAASLFIAATLGAAVQPALAQPAKQKFIAAAGVNLSYPPVLAMQTYLKQLPELTRGAMVGELHHSGAMGGEREVIEATQLGTVQMGMAASSVFTNFDPKFALFDLPFLFRDEAHLIKVIQGPVGKMFQDELEQKKGLKIIAWIPTPARSVYNSKRPVRTLADIKGMKIRTIESELAVGTFNSVGAIATPIAATERYMALQTGTVDGAEVNPGFVLNAKHYEVAKFLSYTEHWRLPALIVVNAKWFKGLPPESQKAITDIGKGMETYAHGAFQGQETMAVDALSSLGMKFNAITDRDAWVAATKPVYTKFESRIGGDLIKRVRETK